MKKYLKYSRINHINFSIITNFCFLKIKKKNRYLFFIVHGIISLKLFKIKGQKIHKTKNRIFKNIIKLFIVNKKIFFILIFKNKGVPKIIKFKIEFIQLKNIFKVFSFFILFIKIIYSLKTLFYNIKIINKLNNKNKKILFNFKQEFNLLKLKILIFNYLFLIFF
jgi:NADH:ubiquinone oxidoreductase subunit 4 (subunit M)